MQCSHLLNSLMRVGVSCEAPKQGERRGVGLAQPASRQQRTTLPPSKESLERCLLPCWGGGGG